MTTAASIREKLERRRETALTTGLLRIPFVMEPEIAERVERIGTELGHMRDRLELLRDGKSDGDPADADVRGSGHDLTPTSMAMSVMEGEVERMTSELSEAISDAQENTVHLLFRRVTADEYSRILASAGGAAVDSDTAAADRFHTALMDRCFVRMEAGDSPIDMSWSEFLESAQLSFGELDPIRTLVFAHNKRGYNSVPFWSGHSRQTPS